MIENYTNQIHRLFNIGKIKINLLNSKNELLDINSVASFNKGNEIGSKNYSDIEKEGYIQYLRVGDLESLSSTFIDSKLCKEIAKENDILIAFDGAPGRNNICLNGAYSSGIYKVSCDEHLKGLMYFELNSDVNKKIINDHSQGTTILHASKAIQYLKYCKIDSETIKYFESLFNGIIQLKMKIKKLNKQKQLLLNKYF